MQTTQVRQTTVYTPSRLMSVQQVSQPQHGTLTSSECQTLLYNPNPPHRVHCRPLLMQTQMPGITDQTKGYLSVGTDYIYARYKLSTQQIWYTTAARTCCRCCLTAASLCKSCAERLHLQGSRANRLLCPRAQGAGLCFLTAFKKGGICSHRG